ncbi:platelet glycoprotein 4-like [Hydra vulgaris]|uniref:Platelet glycoprotein 4-like n=1 Tax=Hydra vulgaris TaxID=6087 RepID=A0ABM4D4M3_HYDVU
MCNIKFIKCRGKDCFVYVTAILGLLLTTSGFFSIKILDDIFKKNLYKNLILVNGNAAYKSWAGIDGLSPVMHFYIFNYTNVDDILHGAKPKIQQLGPYSYRNQRLKSVLSSDEYTFTYLQNYSYVFEKETSCKECNENDIIYTPSLAAAVMLSLVKKSSIKPDSILYDLFAITANEIFSLEDVTLFKKITVQQLLWGYTDKFLSDVEKIAAILKLLKIKMPKISPFVMMQRNSSEEAMYIGNLTVANGKSDIANILQILKWRGKSSGTCWRSIYGNMLNGTDGTRYKPFFERNQRLYMFMPDAFRSIYLNYEKDMELNGIQLYSHTTSFDLLGNVSISPWNQDFCTDQCYETGVLHVGGCAESLSAPIFMSWPHFYQGDETLYKNVDGLSPNKEKHGIFINVEPITGITMQAKIRLQINFLVEKIPLLHIAKDLAAQRTYMPVFFFDETGEIDDENANMLREKVILLRKYLKLSTVVAVGVGLILLVISQILFIF